MCSAAHLGSAECTLHPLKKGRAGFRRPSGLPTLDLLRVYKGLGLKSLWWDPKP